MNNVSHNKNCNQGTVKAHVETTPIPIIKRKNDEKLDKDAVKIKFRRHLTSKNPGLNEFKISLFDNDNPEEFLLFIRNINMTLEASGTLVYSANIQYLLTMLRGGALCQLYTLYT